MNNPNKPKIKTSNFRENFDKWIIYWRENIHRFVVEYMGLEIALFQQIILYLMDAPGNESIFTFVWFASRGLGKTFLTMVYCVAKCILWPGITIKVTSATIRQATVFLQKIYEIQNKCPIIVQEIESDGIRISKDGGRIRFRNKSVIEAVVCSDTARGDRANIIICDESRLMDSTVLSSAIMPLLTKADRGQNWNKEKYREYYRKEHNSKIYLTSIGYKDEWSYKDFCMYTDFIVNGDSNYAIMSLPYQFGIEAGIIDKSYVTTQLKENKTDLKTLRMEMEVIPYGESESSMFTFEDLNRSRQLVVPLVPVTDDEYIAIRGNIRRHKLYQPKEIGEVRVISMDIAVSGGRANDNSVIMVFRLFPNGDHYEKEVSYIEVMNGVNLDDQVLRLKQIFYDLECDYVVFDANGALGINVANTCGNITRDIIRNKQYPGWKTIGKVEKFDQRVTDQNAFPVLYPIQVAGGSSGTLQGNMLIISRLEFERRRIKLLKSDEDVVDDLNKRYEFMRLKTSNNPSEVTRANTIIQSFVNTNELVKEGIETQVTETKTKKLTFDEGKGRRKDRIITLLYGLYFINILEQDLIEYDNRVDMNSYGNKSSLKSHGKVLNPFSSNLNKLNGFGARR